MPTKKVKVDELRFGMYIAELDRTWLETPFLMQGFPLQTDEELKQLHECCEYVYIDVERSRVAGPIGSGGSIRNTAPAGDARVSKVTGGGDTAPVRARAKAPDIKLPPMGRSPTVSERLSEFRSRGGGMVFPVKDAADPSSFVREVKAAKKAYDRAHVYIGQVLEDVRLGRSVDTEGARETVNAMAESIVKNENALLWLTQLKNKDEYTSQHSINVCVISLLFGRHLGLAMDELHELGFGALLHDIGKVKIPLEILNKVGKPTPEELEILREHPAHGYEVLKDTPSIPPSTLEVVYSHHERIDGSGYPQGVQGDAIGFHTMIVSVADVYDAVTSDRVYHLAISPHEALNLMYEWGPKNFHKELLQQFIQCLGIYPIGSIVELNSGEVGVVMSTNRARNLKPMVSVVLDREKKPYHQNKLVNLELMERAGHSLGIKKILERGAYGIDVRRVVAGGGRFVVTQ